MRTLSLILTRVAAGQIRFCRFMLVGLGMAMTLLILLQVFFRFVIYVPFPWSEECARYLMIWMGMLGSVVALQKGRHIGVTFFVEKLPELPEKAVRALVQFAMACFLGILCWQGIEFAAFNADQASPAMEISMLIPFSAIPAGSAMMIIVLFAGLLELQFQGPFFVYFRQFAMLIVCCNAPARENRIRAYTHMRCVHNPRTFEN